MVLGLELGMIQNDVIKVIGTPVSKKIAKDQSRVHNEIWFYKGFRIKFQNLTSQDTIELCSIMILSQDIPLELDIKIGTSFQKAKTILMKKFKVYSDDNSSIQFEFRYGKFMGGIIELESEKGLINKITICRNDD